MIITDEEIKEAMKPDPEWDGDDWCNEPITYPVYGGVGCPGCGSVVMLDIGLVKDYRKSRPKNRTRRRMWLCPICNRRTVVPVRIGEKVKLGDIEIKYGEASEALVALVANQKFGG